MNLLDRLEYDISSPGGLRWKTGVMKGKPAATKTYTKKYKLPEAFIVNTTDKRLQAHRIIMQLFGFDIEGKLVDHIDGNPFNNSIDNLRIVDSGVNTRNRKRHRNNKLGIKGVFLLTTTTSGHTYKYAVGSIMFNGKLKTKRFSV